MAAMTEVRERVRRRAREDAALFAHEFNEPLDPRGDWDSAAWAEAIRALDLPRDLLEDLWPIYQATLIAETGRLSED